MPIARADEPRPDVDGPVMWAPALPKAEMTFDVYGCSHEPGGMSRGCRHWWGDYSGSNACP